MWVVRGQKKSELDGPQGLMLPGVWKGRGGRGVRWGEERMQPGGALHVLPFNAQPGLSASCCPAGALLEAVILVWKVRFSRVRRPVTCLASQSHSQVWEAKPVTAGAMSLLVSRASCREEAWLLVDGFYSGCSRFRAASAAPLTPTALVLPERSLSFLLCAVGIQAECSPRLREETCVISACLATER